VSNVQRRRGRPVTGRLAIVVVALVVLACAPAPDPDAGPPGGGAGAGQEDDIDDVEARALEAATTYLRERDEDPADYRLERQADTADGLLVVWATHLDDLADDAPGGGVTGKSRELHIDPEAFTVEAAYAFQ
jgi:hypothetical protein